jgi:hypothetical protein
MSWRCYYEMLKGENDIANIKQQLHLQNILHSDEFKICVCIDHDMIMLQLNNRNKYLTV